MFRLRRGRRLLTLLAGGALLLLPVGAQAQRSQEVQFQTADKVELHGTFYPSQTGKAPCVILLHKWGGNREQKNWNELAQRLQKDYAVLRFDFRGHGDSTNVDPAFWRVPNNFSIKNASRQPRKISYKDFPAGYAPMLANDVAAAKRYLDTQNDAQACNSSNVIVIGAEEGAAIGALWIAYEFQRPRTIRDNFGRLQRDLQHLEGEDIAAAVWLSIPQRLSNYYVGSWLKGTNNRVRDQVPMSFFFGEKDPNADKAAKYLFEDLKRSGREKLEFTKLRPKATKLAGNELLGKEKLDTDEDISNYLEKVMQKRGLRAPTNRDTANSSPLTLIPLQYLLR